MKNYKAKLGKLTYVISLLILIILGYSFFQVHSSKYLIILICVVVLLALTILFKPLYYVIQEDYIVIKRLIGSIKIPISSVTDIWFEKEKKGLGIKIRLLGVGGFLGFFGIYNSTKLGIIYMYATKLTGLIVIKSEKTYVISPENPEDFLLTINTAKSN
jgi:hypothetical protein